MPSHLTGFQWYLSQIWRFSINCGSKLTAMFANFKIFTYIIANLEFLIKYYWKMPFYVFKFRAKCSLFRFKTPKKMVNMIFGWIWIAFIDIYVKFEVSR